MEISKVLRFVGKVTVVDDIRIPVEVKGEEYIYVTKILVKNQLKKFYYLVLVY